MQWSREKVQQRPFLVLLILVPFLILFFITQDKSHAGVLNGTDYKYTGSVFNDHPEGVGKMVFKNGDVYEGEFKAGNFEGAGTLTNKAEKWRYTGQFKNAQPDGRGVMTFADGTRQKVTFKKGELVK